MRVIQSNTASFGSIPAIVISLLLFSNPSSIAGTCVNPELRQTLSRVENLVFNDHFEQAGRIADSLVTATPDSPFGYLCRATVYLSVMTDAEENLNERSLLGDVDSVIKIAERQIDAAGPPQAAWMYLCIGNAKAFRSLWESRFGSFTSALKLGLDARDAYEKGLALDSTVYDLYGGLGMYHYWKSAKAGILRWFGLFRNDKRRGIQELYLAVDSSCLSSYSARDALIWIRLDQKEYDSAIVASEELLRIFPDGKAFLWPLAKAYFDAGNYEEAARMYALLRERLATAPGNYFNLIECDYFLYCCYEKLSRSNEAREVLNRLSGYYDLVPHRTKQRQKSRLAFMGRAVRF